MTDASLRGDCSRCIGLCCVALAFDKGPHFAFDKAAGEACRHLDGERRCRIHAHLERAGMSGCARYDCRGAGQIATAMFRGSSWRESPATARVMILAFAKLREIQLLRSLTESAGASPFGEILAPADGWSIETLMAVDLFAVRRKVRATCASDVGSRTL